MPPSAADLERMESAIIAASERSLAAFLDCLIVEASPQPIRFKLCRDAWQQTEILAPLVPAIERAAGIRTDYQGPQWFQFYLPRGHAKTYVVAMVVLWAITFAKDHFTATCAASDREQADELRKAIDSIVRHNWWLKSRITINRDAVRGPKGDLEIITSDAASSYGKRRHLYICDELTVWGDNRPLFNSLFSGCDKIPEACFVIISNAGYRGSWQEEIRDSALADPAHWHVYEAPGHLASWLSPETRQAMKAMLTPGEARRVHDNCWINPNETGDFVTPQEVAACQALSRELGLTHQYRAMIGGRYVGAIDYGPRRDRTVCVIGHRDDARDLVIIDQMKIWAGFQFPDGVVPIALVEEWAMDAIHDFHLLKLVIDPFQMEGSAQKLEMHVLLERFEPRGGKANYELAVLLRKLIVNCQLCWYEDAGLLKIGDGQYESFADELLSVQMRTTQYGFRIDNIESGTHDDRAVSVGMLSLGLNMIPRDTGLFMSTVQRHKTDRNIMGVPRQDISPKERLYNDLHRAPGKGRSESAADRRGLYGRRKSR